MPFTSYLRHPAARALLFGAGLGLLGILLQAFGPVSNLESDIGLEWLFDLRGPRPAPREVVIVTIDRESSRKLALPNLPRKWPRDLHATLIDKVSSAGAAVIGFDIIFSEKHKPAEDQALARAINMAGNVILFEYLETENSPGIYREKRLPPIAEFQEAALAVAPFALPKVPEKIKQAFVYKDGAGDAATLPVIALNKFMQPWQGEFLALLKQAIRKKHTDFSIKGLDAPQTPALEFAANVRSILQSSPGLRHDLEEIITRMPPSLSKQRLAAWLFTLSTPSGIFLDFYGPPRTITTLPYHQVLDASPQWRKEKLSGKAVFVGFSERLQPEQKDGFYTVFTDSGGLDISGVEIMATTFANLLEARIVNPLSTVARLGMMFLFGLVAGLILYLSRGWHTMALALMVLAGWLGGSLWLFSHHALWIPLTTPLLFMLPLALISALLIHFLGSHRHGQRLDQSFRRYVPDHVVDNVGSVTQIDTPRPVFACCLSTDVQAYTSFSEKLSPKDLHRQIDKYYQLMFPPVHDSRGIIMDAVGDSMLAIWQAGDPQALKKAACTASLNILQNLTDSPDIALNTRMGLHCGEVSLGSIGDEQHREYRAVGDVINSVSRIEGINKALGTQLIASTQMLDGCVDIHSRSLGEFLLKGKQQSIALHELWGFSGQVDTEKIKLKEQFEAALRLFNAREFVQASAAFLAIKHRYQDGPADFYHHRCEQLINSPPPADWCGLVTVSTK